MPVGTQGAVKAMTARDLEDVGAGILLGNTYHLSLRPGADLIARLGGIHRFMGWSRPILTDSGGYQVFSLASRRQVREEGVRFQSHLDGTACELTPESAVDLQARLGADIAMVLDECPALPATEPLLGESVALTARWAARCRGRLLALRSRSVLSPPLRAPDARLARIPRRRERGADRSRFGRRADHLDGRSHASRAGTVE